MNDYVIRTAYLNKLKDFKEKNLIKVITGIRRSGKSVLMEQFQDELRKSGVSNRQIVSLNFEMLENEKLLDYNTLHDYIKKQLCVGEWTYVFLDEIQLVPAFQKTINSLRTKDLVDIYITGSNSSLLSSELATLLTGRCITIHVLPLSFKEYIGAKSFIAYEKGETSIASSEPMNRAYLLKSYKVFGTDGIRHVLPTYGSYKPFYNDAFNDYMKLGAFPQTLQFESQKSVYDYLEDVYNAIIRKDILARVKSIQEGVLTSIVKFVFHSIGSEISPLNIANTLKSNKRATSYNTVEKYLEYLKDAYIIYEVGRYDIKGKQHLKKNAKYYAVDMGLRNVLLSNKETDIGHTLENIVFLELVRRGYRITVGKIGQKEVDFVAENESGIEYYQVAASVLDPDTLARELDPLNSIKDHFPKCLITLDDYSAGASHNGIRVVNAIDFLFDHKTENYSDARPV